MAKVADFGLCTRIYDDTSEKKEARPGMFPFRWAAYEILLTEIPFKELSDVWSFGVFMWEVFHLGSALPYADHNVPGEIIEFLQNGHRLSKPALCPQFIYDIMLECWQEKHLKRPTFLQMKKQLKHFSVPFNDLQSSQNLSMKVSNDLRYSRTPQSLRKSSVAQK